MAKHRYYEILASHALQKFEGEKKTNGLDPIHARRPAPNEDVFFLVRWSAYVVWTITLSAFAVGALIVLLKPGLFS